jgi:hypothetical protein
MSNVTIKKAKIINGDNLAVTYTEEVGKDTNKVNLECSARIHPDLRTAFAKLDEHLAELCEQYDEGGDLCRMQISSTGFSIGGSGDHEGVVLIGQRALDSGKVLNLTSPFEKWEDEAGTYGNIDDLSLAIEECISEVNAYLFDGKHAPDAQLSLEFSNASIENQDADSE